MSAAKTPGKARARATRRPPATDDERARLRTDAVEKVTQPGGGAIYRGGVPGNRGGTGRTPSIVRTTALDALAEGVKVLSRRLNGASKAIPFMERRAAFDSLARVAFASPLSRADVSTRIASGWDAVSAFIPPEQHADALRAYRHAWTATA